MTKYNNAKLQIISVTDDIVTTSINTHNVEGNGVQLAPEKRRSIWD